MSQWIYFYWLIPAESVSVQWLLISSLAKLEYIVFNERTENQYGHNDRQRKSVHSILPLNLEK